MTLLDEIRASEERKARGPWLPASGGTEVPFTTRDGRRVQYMWQSTTGRHAYLNLDTDVFLTDEQADLL